MECSKMGPLRRLIVRAVELKEGAVAATYETYEAARLCASSLEGRWFDGRRLSTRLIVSRTQQAPLCSEEVLNVSSAVVPALGESYTNQISAEEEAAIVEAVGEDVENFLNSLL